MMKVKKSHWYDWIIGLTALIVLGLSTFYIWLLWNTFQKQIPISYNFWGIPKFPVAYGNHGPIRDTLITGWIVVLLLTFIGLFPGMWQSGVNLLEEERRIVIPKVRTMIETIKLELAVFFSYLLIQTANSRKLFVLTKLLLVIAVIFTLGWTVYKIDQAIQKAKEEAAEEEN